MLEGILIKWINHLVVLTFLLPVGIFWAVALLAIVILTLRELWLGRKHRRKK